MRLLQSYSHVSSVHYDTFCLQLCMVSRGVTVNISGSRM